MRLTLKLSDTKRKNIKIKILIPGHLIITSSCHNIMSSSSLDFLELRSIGKILIS